jgi:hypothetical protein
MEYVTRFPAWRLVMRHTTAWIVILAVWFPLTAAGQDSVWTRAYGGAGRDYGCCVRETLDGGYVVCGVTDSQGAGDGDVYLVRTDANGDTLWTRTYGGVAYDEGWGLELVPDGGFVIVGETSSFGAGAQDLYLIRTDANGDTLWTRTYGGANLDRGEVVRRRTDGTFVVTGTTKSMGDPDGDVYLLLVGANGDTLWTRTYGGSSTDEALGLQITSDGGYIIGGISTSFGTDGWDAYVIKTDAMGDTLWTRNYGTTDSDGCHDIVESAEGGYLFVGAIYRQNRFRSWIVRLDETGEQLWTQVYPGPYWQTANAVQQTPDGGYITAGGTELASSGTDQVHVMRLDASGDTLWTNTYGRGGTSNYDHGRSIDLTQDGHFIVAAESESPGDGSLDLWLLKIEEGTTAVATPHFPDRHRESLLSQNFPNPFADRTNVSFRVPRASHVTINVYNLLGQKVATLANRWMSEGDHALAWDASDHPPGVYFVRFSTGSEASVKRITLVR